MYFGSGFLYQEVDRLIILQGPAQLQIAICSFPPRYLIQVAESQQRESQLSVLLLDTEEQPRNPVISRR